MFLGSFSLGISCAFCTPVFAPCNFKFSASFLLWHTWAHYNWDKPEQISHNSCSLYTNSYVCNQAGRLDRHMTHSIMCNSSKTLGMLNISMHGSFSKTASSEVWANSLAMQDCLWQTKVTQMLLCKLPLVNQAMADYILSQTNCSQII